MRHLCKLLIVACALTGVTSSYGQDSAPSSGQKPPILTLQKLLQAPEGGQTTWESLGGKVVILEFWATWCGPCTESIPHLNSLADQFKDKPVQFIAVTDEPQNIVTAFLAKSPIHAWIGLDNTHATFQAFHISQIPTTVLVRPDGAIDVVTHPTQLKAEHLSNLLAGKPSGLASRPAPDIVRAGELPNDGDNSALFQIVIRPSKETTPHGFGGRSPSGPLGPETGKSFVGYTLHELLPTLYGFPNDRIVINGQVPDGKYELVVKVPVSAEKFLNPRTQDALESTFSLKSHRETREMDVYVASVSERSAKGLKPTTVTGSSRLTSNVRTGNVTGVNAKVSRLLAAVEPGLGHPIIDETKLDDGFDVDLTWEPAGAPALVRAVREQLGITLTLVKKPVEVLVIDPSTR